MLKILGADKVHFCYVDLHPELMRVAKYYEEIGLLELQPFVVPSTFNDTIRNDFQILQYLPINDCFYRVKNLYDFVLLLDVDEIVLPMMKNDRNWNDLFRRLNESAKFDAFATRSVSYSFEDRESFEGIPKFLHMMSHVEVKKSSVR